MSLATEHTFDVTDFDTHLWLEGRHTRAYRKLGAHLAEQDGRSGTHFAVWAPGAVQVSVIGEFNGWRRDANPLELAGASGIWEGFVPEIGIGAVYKYAITSKHGGYQVDKADPYGFAAEIRPQTASKVWDLNKYRWNDAAWLARRGGVQSMTAPMSIYEVHLGSWRRGEGNRWLTFRELASQLADYAHEQGYTHVELLPVMEHPFDGSWGYQTVGYFAPTSRFGTPDDFMAFIDTLHQRGLGVILDWVPAHFPRDEHGLAYFDGTHLYEYADPRRGEQKDWGTYVFDFGKHEVVNFLIGNALFWLDKYHIDGLRVDAVASMLYLDYSRKEGEWLPNKFGGRENLEAIEFLRRFNQTVYKEYPDVVTIAEESTAWPQVSKPTYLGGLGFGYKWDMGWMHDTLDYLHHDPIFRRYHHDRVTFRQVYANSENFVLPLSHDEVVYGKGSLLAKMPGDDWRKFANLRLLYGYQFAQQGKKLQFMGAELGQWSEWNHDAQLDWPLLQHGLHRGLQRWVRDLNTAYRAHPALHEWDCDRRGFEWIDASDADACVLSWLRRGSDPNEAALVVCNFTPTPQHNYRVGAPAGGHWQELLNSDAPLYGGSGQGNLGGVEAAPVSCHGRPYQLTITVPPLGMVVFKRSATR